MIEGLKNSLYVPTMEHDACGIGFVANLKGKKSHKIVDDAITMLEHMNHRGASGAEKNTGDGAGILIQVPHDFFEDEARKLGFQLPAFSKYGVGMVFFPSDYNIRKECRRILNENIKKFGFEIIGYREVPTNNKDLGSVALEGEPHIEQVFIKPQYDVATPEEFERRLFVLRKYSNPAIRKSVVDSLSKFHIVSLSFKTIVYKGQLNAIQLCSYYPDLSNPKVESAIALVHSRFSTNTFPSWKMAQPFRFLAHNGEINTIRGNINWMKSYETLFRSSQFTKEEFALILPMLDETQSDSSNLDKIIELLILGGRSIAHVMMMLVPEAWENDAQLAGFKKDFYKYYSALIQPWDGPASICFTDGKVVGAILDRNGLRPSRYCLTNDDMLIMSSEAGALSVDPSTVIKKGRLEPGKIFIADLEQGKIIDDEELKRQICNLQPYGEWIKNNSIHVDNLPEKDKQKAGFDDDMLLRKLHQFGFSAEDLQVVVSPMIANAKEALGSMGADTPLAVLSDQSQHITHYFKQLFAQVSNPPMDSLRERMVMTLNTSVGKTLDILAEKPEHSIVIEFSQPVLTNRQLAKIKYLAHPKFRCKTIDALFEASGESGALEKAIDKICQDAEDAIRFGSYNILLISDRKSDREMAAIPSLLALGAIHQHLISTGLRVRVGLLVEAGDVREVHHFASLIGYGANAVNPYMVFESIRKMQDEKLIPADLEESKAIANYTKAIGDGLLKVFSKMGISTLRSYHGAQIFEILGLSSTVVDRCFKGTISRIEGLDFDGIAGEALMNHYRAFPKQGRNLEQKLPVGGLYQWKRQGEYHSYNPDTITLLQQATRTNNYELYKQYAHLVNDQTERHHTLRGLLSFNKRKPILVEEVEPVEKIMKRFATGAMSFGSISYEAHTTIAIAMNRMGARSNSGEGGEDERRFEKNPDGSWERSAIKQVASGRFGVTSYYLTNADELQIKIAQGAKPGEGGQLPGNKVDERIGRVRHSTPGVGLISPPPHHDIYSIEDLAQLIFDLKNANRQARISVKLVAEAGVGTIASGVAKAHADVILISGGDGGTGASPISSIRHTGLPWELGLAEAHQTLVANNLRSRVTLQADGQIKTGKDIAVAALLGAEEWGMATSALVVLGCLMMRQCHNNTCPTGIATQNADLRKLFKGKPEYLTNYFTFLAQDLREIMAGMGFRTVNEMIGQSDFLKMRDDIKFWKAKSLDLSPVLYKYPALPEIGLYKQIDQEHGIEKVLDLKLLEISRPAFDDGKKVYHELSIVNVDRTTGALLSNEISKKYKNKGLPPGTIHFKFRGSAGQSFGAFNARGLKLELEGEANDYFGKGLSGGELIVYPDKKATFRPHDNVIIGNVALYGATSGEAYIRGIAGQRFCVRNSGAKTVVEGVGNHGCEYMTGGIAVILGSTGKNFAAGMSGGIAYVYDPDHKLEMNCNKELVNLEATDQEDQKILKHLIGKHHKYTGSLIAGRILSHFEKEKVNFVKVISAEYKAAIKHIPLAEHMGIEELDGD